MDLERDIGGREMSGLSRQTGIARCFFLETSCTTRPQAKDWF